MMRTTVLVWIVFMFDCYCCADVSYNQPKFCPNASWHPDAIAFANESTVGSSPNSVFVTINNSIYVVSFSGKKIQMWSNENIGPFTLPVQPKNTTQSIFVTLDGTIYADNNHIRQVYKWNPSCNISKEAMAVQGVRYGLFVDVSSNIYCTIKDQHSVYRMNWSLSNAISHGERIVGTGNSGFDDKSLNHPHGIFVNTNFDLYVADCHNDRIQLFQYGSCKAITVVGRNLSNKTYLFDLRHPTGVTLDYDNNLFIIEEGGRIIGSDSHGFRCIANCNNTEKLSSNCSYSPSLSFDSNGNIFVSDPVHNQIQKFRLITNSCNETIPWETPSTSVPNTMITETPMISTANMEPTVPFHHISQIFRPTPCNSSNNIGTYCNVTNSICHLTNPCLNNGTCVTSNISADRYDCLCPNNFGGPYCETDHSLCQPHTCIHGTCNNSLNSTLPCVCELGWQGAHCEFKIDYCVNVSCQNNGVCQSSSSSYYTCQCTSNSYSGHHCERVATKIVVFRIVSKSFAFVAIIAIGAIAIFVIVMDILKYVFGIDPTHEDLQKYRLEQQIKKSKKLQVRSPISKSLVQDHQVQKAASIYK